MIIERNGVLLDRGGVVEIDDGLDGVVVLRLFETRTTSSRECVLTYEEALHISGQIYASAERSQEQENQ